MFRTVKKFKVQFFNELYNSQRYSVVRIHGKHNRAIAPIPVAQESMKNDLYSYFMVFLKNNPFI
jgi:hypothetical protein